MPQIINKMDKTNMLVLSRVINNCRESDRKIGLKVNISGSAVRSRIKKLEKLKVIEGYTIKIEPPVLGYGIFYIVVSGNEVSEKLEQVKLVGEPFFIVPCVGGITVCGIVVKENITEKIELAKNLMKDVRILTIFEAKTSVVNSTLTKTDLEIIDVLLSKPRQKIDIIAKKVQLSTKTVTRTLEKLQKNEFIQFTAMYDPQKLIDYISYVVLVWIDGDIKIIKKKLDQQFEKIYMQIPFLTQNQIVLFLYNNDIFTMDETVEKIQNIAGVNFTDIFIPKKILYPHKWVKNAIKRAKKSPTLHLTYPTN